MGGLRGYAYRLLPRTTLTLKGEGIAELRKSYWELKSYTKAICSKCPPTMGTGSRPSHLSAKVE